MEAEGGGGSRYTAAAAAHEQRTEEEKAGKPRAGGGGGMKFSVSARAPHGVGALLLIGGAALAGAAFVAWRHARRGKTNRNKKEVSGDGGVVEDGGKTGASAPEIDRPDDKVQGGESPEEVDRPDEDSRAEEEEAKKDNVGVTEETLQVREDAEIVASDESFFQNSEQVQETDIDLRKSSTEIPMHDDDDVEDDDPDEQNSCANLPEITVGDTDGATTVKKGDEDSVKQNDTENDHNLTKNDTENDQDTTTDHMETDNPGKNDLKKEVVPPNVQVDEDVDASDESSHGISRPGIVLLGEQSLLLRGDGGAQEAESMENSPTAQLMMHPDQLLEDSDSTMDTEGETAEAEPGKSTTTTTTAEPVGLAAALSSLVKPEPAEKKELPRLIEVGMKIEQDRRTNPGPQEHRHGLIGKAGGGAAVVPVDRSRSSSMAIVALMFALTIGMAIVLRSYAPPRATKLLMDLLP